MALLLGGSFLLDHREVHRGKSLISAFECSNIDVIAGAAAAILPS